MCFGVKHLQKNNLINQHLEDITIKFSEDGFYFNKKHFVVFIVSFSTSSTSYSSDANWILLLANCKENNKMIITTGAKLVHQLQEIEKNGIKVEELIVKNSRQ